MGIRMNQGYMIIEVVRINTILEVVLAQINTGCDTQYVTWQCTDGQNYYWGHYFMNDFNAARHDLFSRVLELLPEGGQQCESE